MRAQLTCNLSTQCSAVCNMPVWQCHHTAATYWWHQPSSSSVYCLNQHFSNIDQNRFAGIPEYQLLQERQHRLCIRMPQYQQYTMRCSNATAHTNTQVRVCSSSCSACSSMATAGRARSSSSTGMGTYMSGSSRRSSKVHSSSHNSWIRQQQQASVGAAVLQEKSLQQCPHRASISLWAQQQQEQLYCSQEQEQQQATIPR